MRKSGFFPRLALVNLMRNGRFYGPYLLSCGMTAAMYYILSYLTFSDIVASVRGAGYLQSLMYLGRLVVTLFSAVLLLYANSFVMKRRRRELGLYNILGLEKRHTARLMVWETLYCAAAAIVGGLAAGVLLSKLVLLLLLQLSHLPVEYGFEISLSGMADTAALFGFLFLLTLVWNLFGLLRSRPVELLHSASAGEREPRTRRLLVVLGAVTLGAGYATALTVEDPFTALAYFFLAVALVMVGTYCLFTAGSIALLKHLRNSPRYYYQPKHFTAVAGLLYRMKQNAVGLANICILSTMVLVTVSSTVTLYQSCEETLDQMFPYDIQVVQYLTGYGEDVELPPSQQVLEQAEEITSASGCTASHFGWLNLVEGRCWYSGNTLQWVEGSEVRLRLITEADYLRCTGQETDLAEDQVLAYTTGIDLPDTFYIGSLPFHVAQHLEADLPVNGSAFVSSEVALVTLVVADRATLEAVMAQPSGDHFSEEFLVQINLDSSEEAKLALSETLLSGISGEGIAVNSRQDNEATLYTMYGGFLFLGVFLGLLFLLATALIIYYKQISEGYEDQRRYAILRQVGMTDREVRASIHSQILLVFFLPLGTAGIHTAAAYPMVSKLLELFQLTNTARYALCAAGTFAVFGGVYVLVYALTARAYHRIVA